VEGYILLRNGQPVECNVADAAYTTGMLQCQDTGLAEATQYTYTVEAFDVGGNVSAPSAPFVVQTSDATPPSTPGNVTATAGSCTKATVSWSPSQDNTGVTEYLLFMGLSPGSLTQVATAGGTAKSYSNSTLSPATTYYFAVEAEDKYHNISYMSSAASVTTPSLPVAPPNVLAAATSTTKATVTWSPSTGGLPIAHYMVYKGTSPTSLSLVATVNNSPYNDSTLSASTTYYYAVQAADNGKPPAQSGLSAPVAVTTFGPPSVPANLSPTPLSCTKVSLTWSASTAASGLKIANYRVYKGSSASNMTQLAITTTTTYTDTKDSAQTTYFLRRSVGRHRHASGPLGNLGAGAGHHLRLSFGARKPDADTGLCQQDHFDVVDRGQRRPADCQLSRVRGRLAHHHDPVGHHHRHNV
jgi:fibronectin type 3 domain-containing protein